MCQLSRNKKQRYSNVGHISLPMHTLKNLNFFVIDKTTYAHNLIQETVVSAQVSGSTEVYEHVVHLAL